MKKLTDIVERLLDNKSITAEEAVTILSESINRNNSIYTPTQPLSPGDTRYSSGPGEPFWYSTSTLHKSPSDEMDQEPIQ